MANISLTYLFHGLLLSFFFFLLTHNLVRADEKLIEQKCRDTETPTLCIQCIKSDPGGEKANSTTAIASIVINCISNHAGVLIKNVSDLAAAYSSDKKFAAVCEDCRKGYTRARKSLSTATANLKKGDYDNANHYVIVALDDDYVRSCEPGLQPYEFGIVPPGVFYQIRVYEDLSGIAMTIIDRLLAYKQP